MRRQMAALIFAISMSASAQVAVQVPGTFSKVPAYPPSVGIFPTTPSISLGSDLTPTVVTTHDPVAISTPLSFSVQPNQLSGRWPGTLGFAAESLGAFPREVAAIERISVSSTDRYILRGSMADDSISLGEFARKLRHGQDIVKHTLTNADVQQLKDRDLENGIRHE